MTSSDRTGLKDTWITLVDTAPYIDRLAFIRFAVRRLYRRCFETGAIPSAFELTMRFDNGLARTIPIAPRVENKQQVVRLAQALEDNWGNNDVLHVASADVIDAETDTSGAGLALFIDARPALTIGWSDDQGSLVMRFDGFDRSIIGLTDDVPGLFERVRRAVGDFIQVMAGSKSARKGTPVASRNAAAEIRRKRARDRQEQKSVATTLGLSLPGATLRPATRPVIIRPVNGVGVLEPTSFAPIVVPIRGVKDTSGAYPPRQVLENLRAALGVHALLTEHKLRALLGTPRAAKDAIEAVACMSVAHLRDIGPKHLSVRTAFDTEKAVAAWAAAKYPAQPKRNLKSPEIVSAVEQELSAVRFLSAAYIHAGRVIAALDEAEGNPSYETAPILERAYEESPHTHMSVYEIFQVAVFGDINPSVFWIQHIEGFSDAFEVGRAMGRIQVGIETVLSPHVLGLLKQAMDRVTSSNVPEELMDIAAQAIATTVGEKRLTQALHDALASDSSIRVGRTNRNLIVEPPAPQSQAS